MKSSQTPSLVVMLGGGLDTTALLIWLNEYYSEWDVHGLFVNYGQKAYLGEMLSSQYFCSKYDYHYHEVECGLGRLASSPILDQPMVKDHAENLMDGRNVILFSLGGMLAASIGASALYVGLHSQPATAPFPDSTYQFYRAFDTVLQCGYKHPIAFEAPFVGWSRQAILDFAVQRDQDILTYSFTCYESRTKLECGKCTSCLQKKDMVANV